MRPNKHNQYSVGVLYLVILNLPLQERYKNENILKVSYIQQLKKEITDRTKRKWNINNMIRPLVDELIELFKPKGYEFYCYDSKKTHIFHAMLLLAQGDIPALHELMGFSGHTSKLGCHYCLQQFENKKQFYSKV